MEDMYGLRSKITTLCLVFDIQLGRFIEISGLTDSSRELILTKKAKVASRLVIFLIVGSTPYYRKIKFPSETPEECSYKSVLLSHSLNAADSEIDDLAVEGLYAYLHLI